MKGNTTPVTKATFNTDKLKALGWKPLWDVESGFVESDIVRRVIIDG